MSDSCLIDTNVLLYAYDPSDPGKHRTAVRLLDSLAGTGSAILSTQVLAEFHVVVTRKLRPALSAAAAEERVHRLSRTWVVASVTPQIVFEAIRGVAAHKLSFWDAVVWATARLNQVPIVLSEDFSNGHTVEGVTFRNPFAPRFDIAVLR